MYAFCLCALLLREVSGRVCGTDITLVNFHVGYANGEWHYNGNNIYKKTTPTTLYIWQPVGYTAWLIGFDPTVLETGGDRGHFGWCGQSELRDCDATDWWYWDSGWFNDANAAILHSKVMITGMVLRPQFNGLWDYVDSYVDTANGGYTQVYSKEDDMVWWLYPAETGWAIGYALPTHPVTYEPFMSCHARDVLRCWEYTWTHIRTGAVEDAATMSCSGLV